MKHLVPKCGIPNQSYALEVRKIQEREAGKLAQSSKAEDKEERMQDRVQLGPAG